MSTVLDATTRVTLRITEADHQAVQCSPSHCVVANAARRHRGVLDVRIGATTARLLHRRGWVRYTLHPSTKAAIKSYDEAGQLLPVGFLVELVPPRAPLGARAGSQPGSTRRSGRGASVATRRPSHRHINVEPVA